MDQEKGLIEVMQAMYGGAVTTLAAAATDLASAITLVNSIRTIIINNGLVKA